MVLDRLGERYDHPRWSGPRLDALSELVLTILSQNTADVNSARAFDALRSRYADWEQVLAAATDELIEVIRPGGLAPTKAARIKRVLGEVRGQSSTLDLAFLADLSVPEARAWLSALPGIGPKTASIVLLFGFGKPAMPVDTHVHRVALRLGLLPPRTPVGRAHELLEASLRPEEMYAFHVELIRHGRDTCRAPRPICGLCPLTDVCAYYRQVRAGRAAVAPIPRRPPERRPRYHDELIHGAPPPE